MADELWIDGNQLIPVTFDTKGYKFYKGARGPLGTPVQAFLRLVAVKGEDKVEISSVEDLRQFVTINSPEQALEFVRLFTSIDKHYLFPAINYIEPRRARGQPGVGELTAEDEKRLNLEPPKVRAEDDTFIVERNLLERSGKLFRATESVGKDGTYALVAETIIDKHAPVIYPIYE